jgi:hypothetical protein
MSEIEIIKSDKELTSFEVFMKVGNMLVGLLGFIGLFIGIWVFEGTILPMIFCGLPLTFVVIMLVYKMMMHFLGFGKLVISSENSLVLRTPSSGKSANNDPVSGIDINAERSSEETD